LKVLPFPMSLETLMKPPWLWMIPSEVESPRPVPLPMSLVVKKGSKILSRIFAGMPVPVSLTEMTRYGPGFAPWFMLEKVSSSISLFSMRA
jgi:hypothetical protein